MATPRPTRVVLALLSPLLVLPLLGVGAAMAAPERIRDARQELEELNERVSIAVEDYDEARLDLANASRKSAGVQGRAARTAAKLKAAQGQLGGLMASAYMYGGGDEFVQLMTTASPQNFLDKATSLDQIARGREEQIRELKVLRRQLKADQDVAASVLAAERAIAQRLQRTKADIERQVRRQEALLNQLEGAEARRIRLANTARASRTTQRVPLFDGPPSARAGEAIDAAMSQLGKPYRWGAAGPNSYDCSGLMMWAWAHAGVSLPHSSRAQYNAGRHVSRSQLKPGDLVFFGSPIHHVGMYIGGGNMVAAPHSGDVVKVSSINRSNYTGAVRL